MARHLPPRHIFTAFIRDISERRRLESAVLEISEHLQRRIGQDLHDDLGQQLTGVGLMFGALRRQLITVNPKLEKDLATIDDLLSDSVRSTRDLSHGLAPVQFGVHGLANALKRLAETTSEAGKVECHFHCPKEVLISDAAVSGHLYRIAQEAVNNALKHGKPGKIEIELSCRNGTVRLRVSDNGKGLIKTRRRDAGIGLDVMNYRANVLGGTLAIDSKPGKGVTVDCTVPF